jgi:hypothetical protein
MRSTSLMVALFLGCFACPNIYAHSGGLNANGCHTNRKTGEYHCHRAQQSTSVPSATRPVQPLPAYRAAGYADAVLFLRSGECITSSDSRYATVVDADAFPSIEHCLRAGGHAVPSKSTTRAIDASPKENTVFSAVVAGKSCYEHNQSYECTYRVGKSLYFVIGDIGRRDTGVTFFKADQDGDFYATFGMLHECVIVKPGRERRGDFNFAFVSPANGRVYETWEQCQRRD